MTPTWISLPPPSLSRPTTYRELRFAGEPEDNLVGDRASKLVWPDCAIFCSWAASRRATLEGWISPGSNPPAWRPDDAQVEEGHRAQVEEGHRAHAQGPNFCFGSSSRGPYQVLIMCYKHTLFLLECYLTLAAEFEVALADGNFFVCVLL